MKERHIDFNKIAKETLSNKFPLQEFSLPDDLKSFRSKNVLGLAKGKNYLFVSGNIIEKFVSAYFSLSDIINISIGLIHPKEGSEMPLLVFEKMEILSMITYLYIDFIPLSKSPEYEKKYIEPLRFISDDLDFIPGRKNALANSFGTLYSFSGLFKRHHKFSAGIALERYLELLINFLGNESVANSPEYSKEIRFFKNRFREKYPSKSRSISLINLLFGKIFTDRFLKEVLF